MFRKIILAVVSALVSAAALSQIPISGLPNATLPLGNADQLIVNQKVTSTAYSTRQAPLSALSPFFPSLTSHYLLQAADPTLTQSRVLTGTANQVILTDGGALGNLTLSLPQSICTTCGPTFSSLTLTGPLNGFSGVFSSTLQSAGYTGTTGVFSGALSAGSLSLTTPLPVTSGGTGFGVYAIGDLLTASATNTLSKLSDVAAGSYLRSGGVATIPGWSVLTLPNAATTGDILTATGSNAIGNLADVAAGHYLRSGGTSTAPAYSTTTIPNTAILGDLWYGSAGNVVSALTGNITTTKQFLTQTGTGAVSAAPAWGTIATSDLPAGTPTGFATPTGKAALTATAGVATTAIRSDANIAIDVTISPTWSGTHTFSNTVTEAAANVTGSTAPTNGVYLPAASTFGCSANSVNVCRVSNAATQFFGPTAAALVNATPDTGTATGTVTGCTTAPTPTVRFARMGNIIVAGIDTFSCTSNSVNFTITGAIPAAFQTTRSQVIGTVVEDNGVNVIGGVELAAASSTIVLTANNNRNFTASGTKGPNLAANTLVFEYFLN